MTWSRSWTSPRRAHMHTLWCTISLKKNSRFPAKSRKQRVRIFCPRQIYGSKGSYRQNILNMGVSAITRCSVFAMTRQKKAHGAALLSCQRSWITLQIIVACLCYRNRRCRSREKRARSGAGSKLGILGCPSVLPPQCQPKVPGPRNEREKGRAPALVW